MPVKRFSDTDRNDVPDLDGSSVRSVVPYST